MKYKIRTKVTVEHEMTYDTHDLPDYTSGPAEPLRVAMDLARQDARREGQLVEWEQKVTLLN